MGGEAAAYSLGDSLCVQELFAEGFPVLVVARLLDDNLLKVVGQLENDELVLLAELEVVPGGHALLVDSCSVKRMELLVLCPHNAEVYYNVMFGRVLAIHQDVDAAEDSICEDGGWRRPAGGGGLTQIETGKHDH